jgi:hypothetical protein
MLNAMSKKILLMAGCLVSGIVVASENAGAVALKQDLASAVVAQQFCDHPGKHAVEILNERPGYHIIAGNSFPMVCPSTETVHAIMVLKGETTIGWDHSPEPIHQAALTKNGDLTVTLCNGQKNTSNIFDREKPTVTIK